MMENAVIGLIGQMIENNQLSDDELAKIKNLVEERQKEQKKVQKCRCLAEAVEAGMDMKIEQGIAGIKEIYKSVIIKCFKETETGNLDCRKLTENVIKKFISDVRKTSGLNDTEMKLFMGMLKNGLKKMADNGNLEFVPSDSLYDGSTDSGQGTVYIENPYTMEETERILQWAEGHPADVRGIAISLWFAKGISLTEIVHLTKKDCWDRTGARNSIMEFDKNLFRRSTRSQIVWKSLSLHPKTVKEVFAIPNKDRSGWEKLTEGGLQKKLWHICKDTGTAYKRIEANEALKI